MTSSQMSLGDIEAPVVAGGVVSKRAELDLTPKDLNILTQVRPYIIQSENRNPFTYTREIIHKGGRLTKSYGFQ